MDAFQSLPPWPPLCQSTLISTPCLVTPFIAFHLASLALHLPFLLLLWPLLLTLLWRLWFFSSTLKDRPLELLRVCLRPPSLPNVHSVPGNLTHSLSFIYHISPISQPKPKMISHFPSEKTQKAFWPNWKRVPSGMRLKQPKFYFYQLMDFIIHIFWRRQWHPTPVLLPGKSHGQRSLVGCSPWGRWGSDTTERIHFHFSLSCIGEGNGNPLQCSCLENPRDGGAWWAAIYGVTQSRTWLKWLSSSSIHIFKFIYHHKGLPKWC